MATPPNTIEFIGGPFDGYRTIMRAAPEELRRSVVLPVTWNLLRLLNGDSPLHGPTPITSLAEYELVERNVWLFYRHRGSVSIAAADIADANSPLLTRQASK